MQANVGQIIVAISDLASGIRTTALDTENLGSNVDPNGSILR